MVAKYLNCLPAISLHYFQDFATVSPGNEYDIIDNLRPYCTNVYDLWNMSRFNQYWQW